MPEIVQMAMREGGQALVTGITEALPGALTQLAGGVA